MAENPDILHAGVPLLVRAALLAVQPYRGRDRGVRPGPRLSCSIDQPKGIRDIPEDVRRAQLAGDRWCPFLA